MSNPDDKAKTDARLARLRKGYRAWHTSLYGEVQDTGEPLTEEEARAISDALSIPVPPPKT